MQLFKDSSEKKQSALSAKSSQGAFRKEQEGLLNENTDFFIMEAYKTLRTNLIFSLASTEGSKVLIVTSSMQSEGKSTSSSNVAISFAQDGKKVLLVDCDLRKPKLNRLFDLTAEKGLSDVLVDHSHLSNAIIHTNYENLDLIISGTIPPNPSELLSSKSMKDLIARMREGYDLVVLDTPPLAMVTDALVLVPASDAVLLVVRADYCEANAVAFALDQLSRARARVLGFLLNAADIKKTSYGYGRRRYSKYGYGYRYGYRYGYGGYGGYGYGYGYGYGHRSKKESKEELRP